MPCTGLLHPGQIVSAVGTPAEARAAWPSAVTADAIDDEAALDNAEIAER